MGNQVEEEEAKLQRFLQWLQANKVELRDCEIKYCGPNKGFGLFSIKSNSDGVLLVVPLDLSITPMRVLEDPSLGLKCRAMFEEGEVDDRFLMILFLTVERLRKNSSWKPYIDMLPITFGNPLWFTDDELMELKGTTLYRASQLQQKKLQFLYEDKVKDLVNEILGGDQESVVHFEDFLWANSIFWTRALNIPFPRSYVFPQTLEEGNCSLSLGNESGTATSDFSSAILNTGKDENGGHGCEVGNTNTEETSTSTQVESVWVEGLVPGIDFCNHDLKAAARWEVDGVGSVTGVPASMYLVSAEQSSIKPEKEICISYGNKGNEELLYLYGFVIDNNPDDYLMVSFREHFLIWVTERQSVNSADTPFAFPVLKSWNAYISWLLFPQHLIIWDEEAFQSVPFADSKAQLLEIQKSEMRCLLPRSLLDRGFFSVCSPQSDDSSKFQSSLVCNYSWCGQRKIPSYLNKLVFPEDFLTSLRIIAMKEEELLKVSSLLEELVGPGEEKQLSDTEVRAAVWEVCGDQGALQLLVDLLQMKMMELEDGSGTEDCDTKLLEKVHVMENPGGHARDNGDTNAEKLISRNKWSSIIYRRGQKQLTRLFLKEAEHALQLCLSEQI